MLRNSAGLGLGTRQDGEPLDAVELPPWADGSPEQFVALMRLALESEHASANLHHWIDLTFGARQRGPESEAAANVYEGAVDLAYLRATRPDLHDTVLRMGEEFGQIPPVLFTKPHPVRAPPRARAQTLLSSSLVLNTSLARRDRDGRTGAVLQAVLPVASGPWAKAEEGKALVLVSPQLLLARAVELAGDFPPRPPQSARPSSAPWSSRARTRRRRRRCTTSSAPSRTLPLARARGSPATLRRSAGAIAGMTAADSIGACTLVACFLALDEGRNLRVLAMLHNPHSDTVLAVQEQVCEIGAPLAVEGGRGGWGRTCWRSASTRRATFGTRPPGARLAWRAAAWTGCQMRRRPRKDEGPLGAFGAGLASRRNLISVFGTGFWDASFRARLPRRARRQGARSLLPRPKAKATAIAKAILPDGPISWRQMTTLRSSLLHGDVVDHARHVLAEAGERRKSELLRLFQVWAARARARTQRISSESLRLSGRSRHVGARSPREAPAQLAHLLRILVRTDHPTVHCRLEHGQGSLLLLPSRTSWARCSCFWASSASRPSRRSRIAALDKAATPREAAPRRAAPRREHCLLG